jgi:hypothetical protein
MPGRFLMLRGATKVGIGAAVCLALVATISLSAAFAKTATISSSVSSTTTQVALPSASSSNTVADDQVTGGASARGGSTLGNVAPSDEIPARVSTERAKGIANAAVSAFPVVGLVVKDAVEMDYPDTTVTEIWLGLDSPDQQGAVAIYIFKNPQPKLHRETYPTPSDARHLADIPKVEDITIPGASEAYVITNPDETGWQLLAQTPDRMVVNVSSGVLRPEMKGNPPLNRTQVEELVQLLVKDL